MFRCTQLVFVAVLSLVFLMINPGNSFSADPQNEALPDDLGTRKFGADWESFLGKNSNSYSPEKGIAPWPASGPKILWGARMAEGYSMPAISRGRAFLFDQAKGTARLRCCNSENGKELWSFTYDSDYQDSYGYSNGPRCYPVVDGARVYILGPEGLLHCINISNGKVIWKINTVADFNVIQNFFGVGSTPTIDGELLLVPVGGSPKGSDKNDFSQLKGNGSAVVAFNKYTGKIVYQFSNELASYSSPLIATIDNRKYGLHFARGGLIGFEPATGKQDFFFPWRSRILESVNAATPVVVGNKIFISETYGPGSALLEVNKGAIKVLWDDETRGRDKAMLAHWNTPIHVDGFIYGSSGRHKSNAELRCIELNTGKVKWSVPELTRCSLLQVDGHFICQAEDGLLYLIKINPEKFEKVSVASLSANGVSLLQEPCWSAPVLSHGLLYVRGRNTLICIDLMQQ
ncbi:MAG: PQQ-binding-like beta-propeller repeat protein [Planctomycetota bacterium]